MSKVRLCTHNLPEFHYHVPKDLQRRKNAEAYLNDTLAKAVTTGESGQSCDPRGLDFGGKPLPRRPAGLALDGF